MGLEGSYQYGQTPLDDDELLGLRLASIRTKQELNEAEQLLIEETIKWTIGKRWTAAAMLSRLFICRLHERMFGQVWDWAGKFRLTEKNIGVPSHLIRVELRQLLEDVKHWIIYKTYLPDEIAIRYAHRLVAIHCFPNGNGRHSRLVADLIIAHMFEGEVFSWGRFDPSAPEVKRLKYIRALRQADAGKIESLLAFARS